MNTTLIRCTLAVAAGIAASAASAATITIVNNNGAGIGFNDTTPVAALPSNPGTTLGAQRLFAFQAAANQWGALLNSAVEIKVSAQFTALTCSGTSAVLGSAGGTTLHSDFANAPMANTWYSGSLASSLAGTDLNGATAEINANFNVDIDNGTCLTGTTGWYYSTLASDTTPAGRIPLLPVVFHELAHGLGFQTFTTTSTGAFNSGRPDIWTNYLFDTTANLTWRDMATNAQRQASAINDPHLVWIGPHVTADQTQFLGPGPSINILAPAAIAGESLAQTASFGPALPVGGITGNVVAALDAADAAGPTTTDGCSTITNPATVNGNIALLDRGTCTFVVKVKNAQDAGAVAVIIANNAASGLPGMGGSDPTIVIPSLGALQSVGTAIRAQLAVPATVTVKLGIGTQIAGTEHGFVRMNAPNPLVAGSSVSHWTPDAFPNLLMEPALNTSIFDNVDLTIALFRDIGWSDNAPPGNYVFSNGFE